MTSKSNPASKAVVVVESDTVDFIDGECRALWVGVSGQVTAVVDGAAVAFVGVQGLLPIACTRVNDTGTDASLSIVALY